MRGKFTKIKAKLQGSSLAYQLFQVFRYGFLLLVSVSLTWIFPDQVVIRQYELLLLLGGSLTFFWVSGLYDGFLVLYRQANEKERASLVFQAFAVAGILSLLSAVATWGLGTYALPGQLPEGVLIGYSLFLLFDLNSHLLVFILLGRQSNLALLLYGFGIYFFYFLLITVPLALGQSLETALFYLAAFAAIKFFLLLFWMHKDIFRPVSDRRMARTFLKMSGPLALAMLLSQSAQYVDGYLVEHYYADQFAAFRYGAKELPLVLLLANSMSVVRSGDIAVGLSRGEVSEAYGQLRKSSARLIHTMFPVSLLILGFSTLLFTEVLGEDFRASVPVFDLYLLLVIPRLLFPQSILRGYRRTSVMTLSAAIELVLNVVLSLVLMKYWGIAGIAAATVIAFFVEKVVLLIYCERKLKIRLKEYTPLLIWLLWSIAMLGAWALKYLVFKGL